MSDADFIAWVQKAHTVRRRRQPGQVQASHTCRVELLRWHGIGDSRGRSHRRPDRAGPALLGSQRGCPGDGRDWRDVELFRQHHRRQFGGLAAGDPVLHRQSDAAERHRDIPGWKGVKGRVPVAEFLPERQSHRGRRSRRLCLPRHEKETTPARGSSFQGSTIPRIVGVICRYYLYRRSGGASDNAAIEALYEKQQSNPAILEIVGTFAPLFARRKDRHRSGRPAAGLERRSDSHAAGHAQQRQRLHRARARGPAEERRHHLRRFLRHLSGLFPDRSPAPTRSTTSAR